MAIVTFILGQSGSGKSYSLRNLNPEQTALINVIGKPLPFRGGGKLKSMTTDNSEHIYRTLPKIKSPVIVIDDFQYIMANEFMRRSHEKGYDKFNDIGRNAWDILNVATSLPADKRVYILSHTQENESGRTSIKTIGKMLDDKITPEGMVTIVLRTQVIDGKYRFVTQNNGNDTTKSPAGMFADALIDNDLAAVDAAVCEYYGIGEPEEPETQPEDQPEAQTEQPGDAA